MDQFKVVFVPTRCEISGVRVRLRLLEHVVSEEERQTKEAKRMHICSGP